MRRKRMILIALIATGCVCMAIPIAGCTDMIRWGDEWESLGGPIEAWGKEIVGYREVY